MVVDIDADIRVLKPDARWLSAPGECDVDFLPAFSGISKAVQIALREFLPLAYFDSVDEFQDQPKANAVLLFQATPPFHPRVRTDLTYDVLSPIVLETLARRSRPALTQLLTEVEAKLRVAHLLELSVQYAPRRAVLILASVQRLARSRRCLLGLIRGEAALVDALVRLAGAGELSHRKQTARMASFSKKWNFQLRRMCSGRDFSFLGPSILEAATQALASFQQISNERPGRLKRPEPHAGSPETGNTHVL
jgi:hypothetical protein